MLVVAQPAPATLPVGALVAPGMRQYRLTEKPVPGASLDAMQGAATAWAGSRQPEVRLDKAYSDAPQDKDTGQENKDPAN